ncbi:MAG: hypothetical protein COA50_16520 [Flavobacteriaceae bacterium]|nr:MAG: hypothetical protein COA50_16520 [Flavobacteriaceae bacterium]
MVISLKLDRRKNGLTTEGYPIIVYVSHQYKQMYIRLGYWSSDKNWNQSLAVPKKSHPKYYELLDYVDLIKERISEIIKENHRKAILVSDIKDMLFKKKSSIFYIEGMMLYDENYRGTDWSALRSFNKMFPNRVYDDIDTKTVQKYADNLLRRGNKARGVDSYVRSLRAVWNRLDKPDNPFRGIRIEIPEKINPIATTEELIRLRDLDLPYSDGYGSLGNFRDYFLLMFYLGGIDPEVIAKLRYDKHLIGNRIQFNRDKGKSKTFCNNIVPEQAWEILRKYHCKPYFVPIHQATQYKTLMGNFQKRFRLICARVGAEMHLIPKSGRYTFIDRAQQLLIDERIASQIVGHKRTTVTSLYSNDFPLEVQDKAHLSIISL